MIIIIITVIAMMTIITIIDDWKNSSKRPSFSCFSTLFLAAFFSVFTFPVEPIQLLKYSHLIQQQSNLYKSLFLIYDPGKDFENLISN